MADLQKFQDELKQLRKSLGGETAKDACDAYWNCLANRLPSTLGSLRRVLQES